MDENIVSLKPNRALLQRYLDSYLSQARAAERQLAVLIVQVRRGQELSALLSSRSVEFMLELMAGRLASVCRKQDRIVRIGDYEFAMILPEILNEGHVLLAANKIMLTLSRPYEVEERTLPVENSIGIALFPDHAAEPQILIQHAESALAEAKAQKLPYALYTDRAMGKMAEAWDMESGIEAGLNNGEFEVYYQPKIDLRTRMLCGAEALVRWRHPKRGIVSPAEFIPVATKSGKLKHLTWSVINMALQDASAWPMGSIPLSVSVNISPTLLDDGLVGRVTDAVSLWGVRPASLILEVTESGVMSQPDVGFDTLKRLRDRGIGISIDDFGTGYSS
ncbi:MAG: EAL domain-containing protein, partial [Gammaproteobacteria bacterium]